MMSDSLRIPIVTVHQTEVKDEPEKICFYRFG